MKSYLIASYLVIFACLTVLAFQQAESAKPKSWVHLKDTKWQAELAENYTLCEDFTCSTPDGLFPNPDDCTTFCHCTNNLPELQTCPEDLVYNPDKQECDWPYNVPCTTCNVLGCCVTCPVTTTGTTEATTRTNPTTEATSSTTTTRAPTTTVTTQETISTERTTTSTTSRTTTTTASTIGTTPSLYQCPPDNEGNGFYPLSPDECGNEYYVCVDGSPYIQTCPNNGIFDPVTFVCVAPEFATCVANFRCPVQDGFYPITGQCTSYYYICVDRELSYGKCPAPGSIFDPVVNACVPEGEASCQAETSTTPLMFTCPPGVTGKYPYPDDCRRYYNCQSNGDYIVSYCPPGQWFVPELGFCEGLPNYPPPAGCSP